VDDDGALLLVRRFVHEVINLGHVELMNEFVAQHHVGHDPLGDHYGPEGLTIWVMELRTGFPDLLVTIDDLIREGDCVASRFTMVGTHRGPFLGLAPTDREVTVTGLAIDRLRDNQFVERWSTLDAIRLMRQLGAITVLRAHPSEHEWIDLQR
jgi:predicted ester cyclase